VVVVAAACFERKARKASSSVTSRGSREAVAREWAVGMRVMGGVSVFVSWRRRALWTARPRRPEAPRRTTVGGIVMVVVTL
jgi:hypothetical protein